MARTPDLSGRGSAPAASGRFRIRCGAAPSQRDRWHWLRPAAGRPAGCWHARHARASRDRWPSPKGDPRSRQSALETKPSPRTQPYSPRRTLAPTWSRATAGRRSRSRDKIARSIRFARRTRASSAVRMRTAALMRYGPRSGTPRHASADAATRGPRSPVVQRTRSCSRSLRRDGAQMIVAGRKRSKRATRFFRGDPHRLVALPTTGKNVFGEARKQICRKSRLLQGEGVIGVWNDYERTVGNVDAQGFVQGTWRQEVEFAVQDHRRHAD